MQPGACLHFKEVCIQLTLFSLSANESIQINMEGALWERLEVILITKLQGQRSVRVGLFGVLISQH